MLIYITLLCFSFCEDKKHRTHINFGSPTVRVSFLFSVFALGALGMELTLALSYNTEKGAEDCMGELSIYLYTIKCFVIIMEIYMILRYHRVNIIDAIVYTSIWLPYSYLRWLTNVYLLSDYFYSKTLAWTSYCPSWTCFLTVLVLRFLATLRSLGIIVYKVTLLRSLVHIEIRSGLNTCPWGTQWFISKAPFHYLCICM